MGTIDSTIVHDVANDVEQLTRSSNRIHILNQHKELHRDRIKATSNVSRTTLQRNLATLEDAGWIHNSGTVYRINPCGELVAEGLLDLVESAAVARKLQPVFEWIPESALDIDLSIFADATLLTPNDGDPYAMINRHVECLREMASARGLLGVTGLHAHEAAHEAIVHRDAGGELVVTEDVAATLTDDPHYSPLTSEMLDTGRFDLFVCDSNLPFSLAILDDTVQLAVDDGGEPKALLESTSEDVRTWAVETYTEYRQQSTPIG
jgi:predicted transcriptional regulator